MNAAQWRLVTENLDLGRLIAMDVARSSGVHREFEDLYQEAVTGLIQAAMAFDPARGIWFRAFARRRIRGQVCDYLRQADFLSRNARRYLRRVNETVREFAQAHGSSPTHADLREALGASYDQHAYVHAALVAEDPRSISTGMRPDALVGQGEMAAAVRGAVASLRPRYRAAISAYYAEGLSMAQIAHRLGLNRSRISQMHKKALETLRAVLERRGIHGATDFLIHHSGA